MAAAVVAALFTPPATLGLCVTVLTVEPLTTTLPWVLDTAVVLVTTAFPVGAFEAVEIGAFFVKVRLDLVTTVALVEALLCSEVLEWMDCCDVARCGESVGIEVTDVLVKVAKAGRGGGSILPPGEADMVVPKPLRVACSFSRLNGRVSFAPAAPAAAYPRFAKAEIAEVAALKGDTGFEGDAGRDGDCC